MKISRLVILPDYQGLGLGKLFISEIGKLSKKPFAITTSQPAIVRSLANSPNWILTHKGRVTINKGPLAKGLNKTLSNKRITFTFVFKKEI